MKQLHTLSGLLIISITMLCVVFLNSVSGQIKPEREIIKTELKIFPNPSRNQVLTIELLLQEITEIRITNIAGKEVFQKRFSDRQQKVQINPGTQINGIYMVSVKTSDNKVFVKKLVISLD
jgi:hypothetical protein